MADTDFHHDHIALALGEIRSTYGVEASVTSKDKRLIKWGYEPSSGSGSFETVQTEGGTETLPTTNSITVLDSTSASDNGKTVTIEGHYLTADGDLVFAIQSPVCQGTTATTLATPLARCSRMYLVDDGTVAAGTITVNAGEGGTVHNTIAVGESQSEKAATSFSFRDWYILTYVGASVLGGNNASVEFKIESRTKGGTWRPLLRWALNANQVSHHIPLQDPPLIIPANGEVRVRYNSGTAGTRISAYFGGYLAVDGQYRYWGTPGYPDLPPAA